MDLNNLTPEQEADRVMEAIMLQPVLEEALHPVWAYVGVNKDVFAIAYRLPVSEEDLKNWPLYRRGKLHRIYGPAYVCKHYDVEEWWKNGEYHRTGGLPAKRHKFNMEWWEEGKLHRIGGPAVIKDGAPKQYWIKGQRLAPKQYKKEMERRRRKGIL